MKTRLTTLLGIRYPIIQAPIGSAATPGLVAEVSNAGGLGMLALTWKSPAETRALIGQTKVLTDRPFGVNLVLKWPQDERVAICLAERVPVVSFFWGDSTPFIRPLQERGIRVCHSVGSADEAAYFAGKGVDFVVAQGWEAGGHVWGQVATSVLVPAVANRVPGVPVVAAGGIADGRGILSALSLGADGVWMGTRFLMSHEAGAHPVYQDRIARAQETDTVYTTLFNIGWDAPHRVIRNSTVEAWEESRGNQPRPNEGQVIAHFPDGRPVLRYSDVIPLPATEGEVEALALYAGQSAGLIGEKKAAREIVVDLVKETHAAHEKNVRLFS